MPTPPALRRVGLVLVGLAIVAAAGYCLHAHLLSSTQALLVAAFGGLVIDNHTFLQRIHDLRAVVAVLTGDGKGDCGGGGDDAGVAG